MGKISTQEQDNGNILLEITYGGKDAPFGGVDTSAPPAYIDPRCFAAADGVIVVDNKLCFVNWQDFIFPALFSGVNATLIKIGTFYNSIYGQLNYALGFTASAITGPPVGLDYVFYLTAWNYNGSGVPTIVSNDTLGVQLYTYKQAATFASLTAYIVEGESAFATASGNLQLQLYLGNVSQGSATVSYTSGASVASLVTSMVSAINSAWSGNVAAAPTVDGFGIIMTSLLPGVAGNSFGVFDSSTNTIGTDPPAFYFPNISKAAAPSPQNFQGGKNNTTVAPPQTFQAVSAAEVGGVLYIANVGPMVLKYAGPGTFAISTMYTGMQVIRKYAGSLIGLGAIPQLGTILQNQDMIFSWSAASNLDVWSPVTSAGLVTGAGFEQLADIADALTGLIVSNGTAYIIRRQGISYASPTGNATLPFTINHIGLGDQGEGSQFRSLVTQYDQVGAFVGNSNIYQISGSLTPIGDKIKATVFSALASAGTGLGSAVAAVAIGGDEFPIVVFVIGGTTYFFNAANGTWGIGSWQEQSGATLIVGTLFIPGGQVTQYVPVIAERYVTFPNTVNIATTSLVEGVPYAESLSDAAYVTFPVEEVMFGRDITIDALYVALWGDVGQPVTIRFLINGQLYNTYTLQPGQFNTVAGNPTEIQINDFSQSSLGAGAFTVKSPQLTIEIDPVIGAFPSLVRFSKITMFGTFDPNQRPV